MNFLMVQHSTSAATHQTLPQYARWPVRLCMRTKKNICWVWGWDYRVTLLALISWVSFSVASDGRSNRLQENNLTTWDCLFNTMRKELFGIMLFPLNRISFLASIHAQHSNRAYILQILLPSQCKGGGEKERLATMMNRECMDITRAFCWTQGQ